MKFKSLCLFDLFYLLVYWYTYWLERLIETGENVLACNCHKTTHVLMDQYSASLTLNLNLKQALILRTDLLELQIKIGQENMEFLQIKIVLCPKIHNKAFGLIFVLIFYTSACCFAYCANIYYNATNASAEGTSHQENNIIQTFIVH